MMPEQQQSRNVGVDRNLLREATEAATSSTPTKEEHTQISHSVTLLSLPQERDSSRTNPLPAHVVRRTQKPERTSSQSAQESPRTAQQAKSHPHSVPYFQPDRLCVSNQKTLLSGMHTRKTYHYHSDHEIPRYDKIMIIGAFFGLSYRWIRWSVVDLVTSNRIGAVVKV